MAIGKHGLSRKSPFQVGIRQRWYMRRVFIGDISVSGRFILFLGVEFRLEIYHNLYYLLMLLGLRRCYIKAS